MKDRDHDDAMVQAFCEDPGYAIEILNSILDNGELDELLIALRQITKAFNGVEKLAQLNDMHIHRALSTQASLEIRGLSALLKTVGLRLVVQPIERGEKVRLI